MATYTKFQPFVEAVTEKKHNLGSDQLVVALTNTAPNATDSTLSQITEVAYTYLSSRNITTSSSAQSSGTYKLVISDLTLTSTGGSTGPFRYIIIYNDTATNDDLIGYYDSGSSTTLLDGESYNLNFDGTGGLLTLA
jgi:hypothetical protein